MFKYVLMNDTFDTWHHGCRAVSRVIRKEMEHRGFSLSATSRVGASWWEDSVFVEHAKQADLILINGEGTFHSGSSEAEKCMRIFQEKTSSNRIALINSIWQDNPTSWVDIISNASYISLRDTNSQKKLTEHGVQAHYCPDLSLISSKPISTLNPRSGVAWGDALKRNVTRDLYRGFRSSRGENYFASVRPTHRSPLTSYPLKDLRYSLTCWWKNYSCFNDEEELARFLAQRNLYITGRFHGACLALCAGTPFVAVASNTKKITFLLNDMGLNPARVFTDTKHLLTASPEQWCWSLDEQESLKENLENARSRATKMFDEICAC
ncbi:polysaccharide pyruvyl transferase family protein [Pseudovibrio denitrificans]|uniref:polysaccharide pyruvyl transferase family protein n=1 Tax=Pseudovibrio denitrificans TaxID=258256 RepID=UPI0039BFE44D